MSASGSGTRLEWYRDPSVWLMIVVVAGVIGYWFMASGRPGLPLTDGDYACTPWNAQPGTSLAGMEPGIVVAGGEVVSATQWDTSTNTYPEIPFREAKHEGALGVSVILTPLSGSELRYVCERI